MKRIGLMGGSFNPIHNGHLHLASLALSGGAVDEVVFLPTGNPPHKRAGLADKLDRFEMCALAVEGMDNVSVSREEIDREGVIYTVDTMARLREQSPQCAFHYIIGADSLAQLPTWRRPEELIRLCSFLVMLRPGEDEEHTLALMRQWQEKGAQMALLHGEEMDISSSGIRARIAQGLPIDGLVPDAVAKYIREKNLYAGG